LATHLAQKTFGKKFVSTVLDQINKRKTRKAEAREISACLLEKLVQSNDAFFYPVAPYYLAFLIIKEKKGENEQTRIITKMLRSSETILNEHIRLQMSFYRKTNPNLRQSQSFCSIDAYKQQKVNIANLLGHYIDSIRTLLGSHYCSVSDLEQAGIDGKKVDTVFEKLKIDCIVQQPKFNDDETIPNLKAAIQHVAIIHNVDKPTSLKKNLTSAFKTVNPLMNENEIEKKIKKEIDISFTRKSFWINMVKKKVLKDAIDFVIMDESECDIEPKLDRKEKLTIDLASKDYVFFSPMPYTAEEMKRKIVFREKYVKDIIKENNYQEYHRRKKTFELNKMGCLNLIELKKVNETKEYEAQLDEDDLRGIHIDPDERKNILAELQNQKIIDDQGYLAPEYEGQEFCYSQCPAYEDAAMGLLGRKFAIEIVIRQWLKSEEDSELLKAIELLPLNPHRNLLADLMASHVIAGARVKDDIDLKQAIEKISDDKEERECLLNYLRSRQALYGPTKSPDDFSLDFIEREIRTKKGMDNVSTELYIFGLAGFDHHIIYENKLSFKAKSQASISILGGLGLMVGGCLLDIELGGVPSLFGVNFLVTGGTASFFNGIETFLLRNKSTWADYGRQSLMNLVGNPAPFEKMSTIWKLFKSRKSIHQTPSHPSSFTVQEQNLTENQLVKVVATAGNILHDPYRLFVSNLVEKINKIVDSNMAQMKETFSKVWQSHNHEDIKRLVKEKMEKLVTDWYANGETWVSEVKEASRDPTLKLDEQMAIIIKHLEHFAFKIRMVHVTVEYLKRFLSDLEEDFSKLQPSALTTNHFDVEMEERFYKKVVENMKSELARKAEQIMELFPIGFESSITKQKDAEQK
jgi:hypothetical protein